MRADETRGSLTVPRSMVLASRPARSDSARGVTLLEVTIVTSIVAVLAAVALPRFAGAISQQRVEAAARRVVLDLALAQRRARMLGTSQTVAFTVASGVYGLPEATDLDDSAAQYSVNLAEPPYEALIVSADFGGKAEVVFDGYGAPIGGVGGSIVIQVGSRLKTITVDGVGGETAVK